MKRLLLSFFALVCAANFSYAQWTTGTNINNTNSGNVGIGTTSPSGKLQVNSASDTGPLSIASAFGTQHLVVGTSANGLALSKNETSGGSAYISSVSPTASWDPLGFQAGNYNWFLAGSSTAIMVLNSSGNVGIGTTAPRAQLSVVSGTDNNGAFFPATNALIVGANNALTSLSSNLAVSSNTAQGTDVGASIGLGGLWLGPGDTRDLEFATIKGAKENSTAGNGSGYLAFGTYGVGGMTEKMRITSGGNMGIGTTDPQGYMLAVNGSAIATSMKVKAYGSWPDYVFKPSYQLPSLTDVKTYIAQNHHLPDMPSEADVAKDDINLGEMDKLLTKKVEELTLYLIEKDAENKDLKQTLKIQQQEFNELKKQVELLTQALNKK